MSAFFMGPDKVVEQPPEVAGWDVEVATPEPRLGFEQRLCNLCGRPWGPTRCTSDGCLSLEFTVSYVQPVPLGARLMDRLRKAKSPRASAAQLKALHHFAATVASFRAELTNLDELLRRGVQDGIEELVPAHALLHITVEMVGDTSPDHLRHLSLALRALDDWLPGTIATLEETSPK